MGFLDRLVGKTPQQQEEERAAAAAKQQQQSAPTPSTSASELLRDTAPQAGAFSAASAQRLYDPYEGISTAVGGRKHAFTLPEGPEYVFQEEAAARRRGWGENLQFYTGVGYLGGEPAAGAVACNGRWCSSCGRRPARAADGGVRVQEAA
jgi:import inner membrane translocase subunit TIM23